MANNLKVFYGGNIDDYSEIDNYLYKKCMGDIKLSLKCKGLYTAMLTEPNKVFTVQEFITPIDKWHSITNGLNELVKNKYIRKITSPNIGYVLFNNNVVIENKNSGYVYCISDGYENYKIGKTLSVGNRLKEFRTSMPNEPIVIKILFCNDMNIVEKQLHEKFKSKSINREWFKLNEIDLLYIKCCGHDGVIK